MKNAFALTLLAAVAVGATANGAVIGDWQMNDATSGLTPYQAADSSGNGYTMDGASSAGNLTNGMSWTSGPGGGANGAMRFTGDGYDGGPQSASKAGYLYKDLSAGTIGDGSYAIVANVYANPTNTLDASVFGSVNFGAGQVRANLVVDNKFSRVYFRDYATGNATNYTLYTNFGTLPANQWNKIEASYDASTHTAKLLINDVLLDSSTTWNPSTIDFGRITIGSEAWNAGGVWGHAFDGDIDSVQLYNTAAVPEPASLALLGLGAVALLNRRRRSAC